MAETCNMADALIEAWRDFSLSAEQFGRIVEEFAAAIDDGRAKALVERVREALA